MAEIRVQTDCDPYPAKAGTPLTNTGNRLFSDGSTISDRNITLKFKYRAGSNTSDPENVSYSQAVGVATNGPRIFSSGASDPVLPVNGISAPNGFNWNTVENPDDYPVDNCGGKPETASEYRYRDGRFVLNGFNNATFTNASAYYSGSQFGGDNLRHPDGHSKIVGFALDGYPIYGPFGYSSATDNTSAVAQMLSSYVLRSTPVAGRGSSYSEIAGGRYIQDYLFDNSQDLDEHNGRYCVTPDYTTGTYAYFLTFTPNLTAPAYPYVVGPSTREQR
jgi:hypothetical protein